jgi:hypothetical protein
MLKKILLVFFFSYSSLLSIEIMEQTESIRQCIGETVEIKIFVNEKADSVHWFYNDQKIIGADDLFFNIGYLHPQNSGLYHCIVFKRSNKVISKKIPVYAISQTQIISEPKVQPFIAGNDYHFKVQAHANGIGEDYKFKYQWFANNEPLENNNKYSGVNSSSLSIRNITHDEINIKYHCLVEGLCGFAATKPKQLIDGEMFGYIEDSKIIEICYDADEVTIQVDIDSPFKNDMKFRWRRAYVGWIEDNEQYSGTKTNKLTVKNIDLKNSTYFYLEVQIDKLNYKKEFGSYHIKKIFPPIIEKDIPDKWVAFDHGNGDDYARINIGIEIGGTYEEQSKVEFEWYRNGVLTTKGSKHPVSPSTKVY